MKKHLSIKIHGRVQAVLFRYSARKKAEELGISGFARNEPDNSVYIEIEGEESNLNKFSEWCRQGPKMAKVESVDIEQGEVRGYNTFEVK